MWAHTHGSARGRQPWHARGEEALTAQGLSSSGGCGARRREVVKKSAHNVSSSAASSAHETTQTCAQRSARRPPSRRQRVQLCNVHATTCSRVMADEAAVEEEEAARTSFVSLPCALQHAILRRVPVDARARAKLVSSGWRDELADVSLWTLLDLSAGSGVTCTVNDAALRGASGLARGGLTALDVSEAGAVTPEALLAVAAANAGALTEKAGVRLLG